MIVINDKRDCSGCYACVSICPTSCISMNIDEEGFWYPLVDMDKCIHCEACIDVCHVINAYEPKNNPKAYAAYIRDDDIRKESSSGGLFTLIAEEVLKEGGVVFGAVFDKNFDVHHDYIEKKEDLYKLRGSKYVHSKIGENLIKAEEFLRQGRKVLFTGTPCQVAGLRFYLLRDYDNLLTMDVICHGVPSPKVWDKYKKLVSKKNGDKIDNVSFRDKTKGWRNFSMMFDFKSKKRQLKTLDEDRYMYGFLRNIYLRPACHRCAEKSLNRKSDITFADYWGVENVHKDFSDDKGIALVFTNTDRGKRAFEAITDRIEYIETDMKRAASYNTAATKNSVPNPRRKEFFKNIDSMDFEKLMDTYCQDSFSVRVKIKINGVIRKLKDIVKRIIRR